MFDSVARCAPATRKLLADIPAQERIAAGEADFAAGDVLDERQVRA
jgi:hypothetical protein